MEMCGKADALANIAVIGPEINIRISAKSPMNYITEHNITEKKLSQQFIDPTVAASSVAEYESWLRSRAQALAEHGNSFLEQLRGQLP
jgi:hypothetical protein